MRIRPADPMVLARRLAGRCEGEFARHDEAAVLRILSKLFRRELTPDLEYIVMMSPEGFTYVHTNAMREGRVYGDQVSLAAAALRSPTSQRYDRNTGEVIREAVVPITRGGAHHSVLRVGQIVPRGSLRGRVSASLGAAAAIPSAATAVVAGPGAGLVALGVGAACAGALAVWNHRRVTLPIAKFNETARAVCGGDLRAAVTGAGRDELGQMGFELNKVVLGLQKVIEAGVTSSTAVSELAGRMAASTDHTATAMIEIAASCHRTQESAEQQTTRAEGAAAAAERLTMGLATCAERAATAQQVLSDARGTAVAGAESLDAVATAMAAATGAVNEGTARVEALRERGQAIQSIVSAISSIAAQTNLLALNAAIEGARAGEQGRGFMVVASEVRNLAEQADAAAHSIGAMVAEVQTETSQAAAAMSAGVAEVASAASSVQGVKVAVRTLTRHLEEVACAAGEVERATVALGHDAGLLSEATTRSAQDAGAALEASAFITSSTRATAAVSQENASAASELSANSQALRDLVGRFRVA